MRWNGYDMQHVGIKGCSLPRSGMSNWKSAGAKYAAYIAPSFASSSTGASLATAGGPDRHRDDPRGLSRGQTSFGVGGDRADRGFALIICLRIKPGILKKRNKTTPF